jgi:hypothetical protein
MRSGKERGRVPPPENDRIGSCDAAGKFLPPTCSHRGLPGTGGASRNRGGGVVGLGGPSDGTRTNGKTGEESSDLGAGPDTCRGREDLPGRRAGLPRSSSWPVPVFFSGPRVCSGSVECLAGGWEASDVVKYRSPPPRMIAGSRRYGWRATREPAPEWEWHPRFHASRQHLLRGDRRQAPGARGSGRVRRGIGQAPSRKRLSIFTRWMRKRSRPARSPGGIFFSGRPRPEED